MVCTIKLLNSEAVFVHGIHDAFPSSFRVTYSSCVVKKRRNSAVDGFRNTAVHPSAFVGRKGIDDLVPPVLLKGDELLKFRDISLDELVDDPVEVLRSRGVIGSGIEVDVKLLQVVGSLQLSVDT